MRERPSSHRIEVGLSVDPDAIEAKPVPEAPVSIALFGDFRGAARGARESVRVDRDNLDEALAQLRPELRISLERGDGSVVRVQFESLDDFHPDRLYERLSVFEGARELQRRMSRAPRAEAGAQRELPTTGNLLDDIVQHSASRDDADLPPIEGGDLQAYLDRIVAPHLVPPADARREALLAELQAVIADGLRALLHNAEFQALESLWRGVRLVTRAAESDADAQIHLFDVSKAELAGAEGSQLYNMLADSPTRRDGSPWTVLVGLYSFLPDAADIALLDRVGAIANSIQAPWIAAADSRLVGWDGATASTDPDDWVADPPPQWEALRRSPHARWIGLTLPRFLLRLPYGTQGIACETLPFQELSRKPAHEDYLWGNPAIVCLSMLLQRWASSAGLEMDGFPMPGTQPCVEALLGDGAVQRIMDRGLMPLLGIGESDRIRLPRFQSIADPPERLGNL